tara:strand:+ start:369 stop:503 length:135 start_codon:yes stop_codon:yes gene_type:complete
MSIGDWLAIGVSVLYLIPLTGAIIWQKNKNDLRRLSEKNESSAS